MANATRGEYHRRELNAAEHPGFLKRSAAWLTDVYSRVDRTRTSGLAAETAFWLFLAIIPLAAVAGLIAARLSLNNWGEVAPVLSSLPPEVRKLVTGELVKAARWNGGAVGITGMIVFAWLASSGVHAIFESLEIQSGRSRSWWKKRAFALATCVALSLAVALLAVLGPGFNAAISALASVAPAFTVFTGEPTALGRLFRFSMQSLVAFAYIAGLYWVGVPPKARRSVRIFPGAAVAVALQAVLSYGYANVVLRVNGTTIYTTGLAVIGTTLMALYLFVFAFLIGAVINAKLGDTHPPSP